MCKVKEHPAKAGGSWIRREKRLAIYLRDGGACAYCGDSFVDGVARLSLDHIEPWSLGGGNEADNLITACSKCNSARGNRTVEEFAKAVANYLQDDANAILDYIEKQRHKAMDISQAKDILSRVRSLPEAYKQAF